MHTKNIRRWIARVKPDETQLSDRILTRFRGLDRDEQEQLFRELWEYRCSLDMKYWTAGSKYTTQPYRGSDGKGINGSNSKYDNSER